MATTCISSLKMPYIYTFYISPFFSSLTFSPFFSTPTPIVPLTLSLTPLNPRLQPMTPTPPMGNDSPLSCLCRPTRHRWELLPLPHSFDFPRSFLSLSLFLHYLPSSFPLSSFTDFSNVSFIYLFICFLVFVIFGLYLIKWYRFWAWMLVL